VLDLAYHYRKKAFIHHFFMFVSIDVDISNYIHRFKKLTYVTYVRWVADKHKAPRPPGRPARLCSSADVSARRT
jgi:hypothetical protein